MNKNYREIFQVAFTYIGALIGAGFVSGQEIFQFFTLHPGSYMGIVFCGFLFIILGYITLKFALEFNLYTYNQFFYKFGGKKIAKFADIIIFSFLFGTLVVMLSGSGEIFSSYLQFNKSIGILITFIIMALTVKFGINGVMKLNLILIPVLVLVITIVFSLNLDLNFNLKKINPKALIFHQLFFYSIIYVSYNLFLCLPVLTAIPSKIKQKKLLKKGSILAGIILTLLAVMINILLVQNFSLVKGSQVPILEILDQQFSNMYLIYAISLWLAMITTGSSNLYGLINKLKTKYTLSINRLLVLIFIVSFFLAKFRFADLVAIIYPFLGNIGALIILFLFLKSLKEKIIL